MDVALVLLVPSVFRMNCKVSILVLVDAALRPDYTMKRWSFNPYVSILVLVDAALRHKQTT